MSKVLKNLTGSPISISDTGVSLPASPATYTIPAQDYLLWAASSDIITEVGAGNVVVNDGSSDLSISAGIDLLKGIFPTSVKIAGDTDGTLIGNIGDALKATSSNVSTDLGTDTITSLNDSVQVTCSSYKNITFAISGTWVATLTFQVSNDNSTWYSIYAETLAATTKASTTAANGAFQVPTLGFQYMRVTATAYTSGTASVHTHGSQSELYQTMQVNNTPTNDATTEHQRIHSGTSYHWSDDWTMSSGTTRYLEIVTDSKSAHTVFGLHTNGETELYVFEAPTITTVTTQYYPVNRNRSSANTTGLTVKLATAVSAEGTELMDLHIGISTGGAASVQLQRGQEFILKASTTYLIKFVSGNNGNDVTFLMDFYHTS